MKKVAVETQSTRKQVGLRIWAAADSSALGMLLQRAKDFVAKQMDIDILSEQLKIIQESVMEKSESADKKIKRRPD